MFFCGIFSSARQPPSTTPSRMSGSFGLTVRRLRASRLSLEITLHTPAGACWDGSKSGARATNSPLLPGTTP